MLCSSHFLKNLTSTEHVWKVGVEQIMLQVKARESTEARGESRTHFFATCYTLQGRREVPQNVLRPRVLVNSGRVKVDTRFHKDSLYMAPNWQSDWVRPLEVMICGHVATWWLKSSPDPQYPFLRCIRCYLLISPSMLKSAATRRQKIKRKITTYYVAYYFQASDTDKPRLNQ